MLLNCLSISTSLPLLLVLLLSLCPALSHSASLSQHPFFIRRASPPLLNAIVIANRASSSISLLDPANKLRPQSVALPKGSDPLYFSLSFRDGELWISDRATNSLLVYTLTAHGLFPIGSVPAEAGVFHSFVTQDERTVFPQVWTACDVARVVTVHLAGSRKRVATLRVPSDARRLGAKPHDVTAGWRYGIASFIGASDGRGYVAAWDSASFRLSGVLRTRKDPHVALRGDSHLFVVAQGDSDQNGEVLMVKLPSMKVLKRDASQPSPHGMFISWDERLLYVTNIAQGGKKAVVVYRTRDLQRVRCGNVETNFAVPHNPVLSPDGKKLYVTHSLADKGRASVWNVDKQGCPVQRTLGTVRTGLNAFGITAVGPQLTRWRFFDAEDK